MSIHVHVRLSLSSLLSSSTSICPSPSSPFSSLSCTSSCTLSSTTRSPCKTCAPPRTRGVTTPRTSPPPSQVVSPTSWPSASSTTLQVPSPTLPRHRTWTLTTLHSASCSPKHQDVDDLTLGKMLTEAHRGQADYCDPEGVSVSQSSSSVVFDRAGKPVEKRDVDQSIGFGVTRNTYSAHSKFSENTQAEKNGR